MNGGGWFLLSSLSLFLVLHNSQRALSGQKSNETKRRLSRAKRGGRVGGGGVSGGGGGEDNRAPKTRGGRGSRRNRGENCSTIRLCFPDLGGDVHCSARSLGIVLGISRVSVGLGYVCVLWCGGAAAGERAPTTRARRKAQSEEGKTDLAVVTVTTRLCMRESSCGRASAEWGGGRGTGRCTRAGSHTIRGASRDGGGEARGGGGGGGGSGGGGGGGLGCLG
jgi:hypothetical protein